MKVGRTLSEVAAEIERQARTRHDYIVDTRRRRLDEDGQTLALDGHGAFMPGQSWAFRDHCTMAEIIADETTAA